MTHLILDTGPLVAFVDRRDKHHEWAAAQWAQIRPPLYTCESVLSEACFLLARCERGPAAVLELARRGVIRVSFQIADQIESISKLMIKYADVPMSLADACLVRMSEIWQECRVMSCDQDFRTYRRHGRHAIPLLTPSEK